MKKFHFLFLSLLLSSAAVANSKDCFEQGHIPPHDLLLPAYNEPARYDTKGSWDVYTTGSFLWWKGTQEGLNLAMVVSQGNSFDPNSAGQIIDLHYRYQTGFRFGIGTNLGHENWNLEAKYAVIHLDNRTSVIATEAAVNQGTGLYPFWLGFGGGNDDFMGAAKARWKCDTDLFDIEMARNYYVGTRVTFRPHAGLRFAKTDQIYKATYRARLANTEFFSKTTSFSRGAGFRTGLDTGWLLGAGFKLFGNVAFSNLFTRYKIGNSQDNVNSNPTFINVDIKAKVKYLRPNAEFVVGMDYGAYAFNDRMHFAFIVAYEQHVFWGQNMMRTFFDTAFSLSRSMRDLYYNGLSITGRIDF